MASPPIYPVAIDPVSTGVFPRIHVAASGTFTRIPGLGVPTATVMTGDLIWGLMFKMPVSAALPTGTPRFCLGAIANATSGVLRWNWKWASVAFEEAPGGATLQAEGDTDITWGAGDNDQFKFSSVVMDGDTIVADEWVVGHLTLVDSGTTIAVASTLIPYMEFT